MSGRSAPPLRIFFLDSADRKATAELFEMHLAGGPEAGIV
jgi:hypothetical protein